MAATLPRPPSMERRPSVRARLAKRLIPDHVLEIGRTEGDYWAVLRGDLPAMASR